MGRTITEADTILFSTLTLSFNSLFTNRDFARAHGHPDIVVNPHLIFNVALGLSVEDLSERGGPFLGVFNLRYFRHVYPGITICAVTEATEARLSASNPANGIVTWQTRGIEGDDETVVSFRRSKLCGSRTRRRPDVGNISALTGDGNYFEDLAVGDAFRHAPGKPVTPLENVLISNTVMNTDDTHFNEARMIWRRGKPDALLHHPDQGSQDTSEQFQRLIADNGVTCSMSRSGNVWDYAAM